MYIAMAALTYFMLLINLSSGGRTRANPMVRPVMSIRGKGSEEKLRC